MLVIYIEASKTSRKWKILIDSKLEFSEDGAVHIQETMLGPCLITEEDLRKVARDIIQEVKILYLGSKVWFKDPFAEEGLGSMNEWHVEVNITQ